MAAGVPESTSTAAARRPPPRPCRARLRAPRAGRSLAELYPPGHRIWRAPIAHFSTSRPEFPWYRPPDDAESASSAVGEDQRRAAAKRTSTTTTAPTTTKAHKKPEPATPRPPAPPARSSNAKTRSFARRSPITGTPYRLAYSSQRTPGWARRHHSPSSRSPATPFPSLPRVDRRPGRAATAISTKEIFAASATSRSSLPELDVPQPRVRCLRAARFTANGNSRRGLGYAYPHGLSRLAREEFDRSWAPVSGTRARTVRVPARPDSAIRLHITLRSVSQGPTIRFSGAPSVPGMAAFRSSAASPSTCTTPTIRPPAPCTSATAAKRRRKPCRADLAARSRNRRSADSAVTAVPPLWPV